MAAKIKISKLDAALRQLRTAILLWFHDEDPVAVHTLAYAAYEIIHAISKKRDPHRSPLLFDSATIREDKRAELNIAMKKHANFFKHADREGEAVIDFDPDLTRVFLLFGILGRVACGEQESLRESAFLWWLRIHHPELFSDEARKLVTDSPEINAVAQDARGLSKREFFEAFGEAWHRSNPHFGRR